MTDVPLDVGVPGNSAYRRFSSHPRVPPIAAMLLVLTGSVGVQLSAAVASTLFASLDTPGVSGLRMAIAGLILFALFRPRIAGRTGRGWLALVLYGAALAFSNLLFYSAVQRIPLGMAVTLEFLVRSSSPPSPRPGDGSWSSPV